MIYVGLSIPPPPPPKKKKKGDLRMKMKQGYQLCYE